MTTDHEEIAEIVRVFFAAFSTEDGVTERMTALRYLFLPAAIIIRTCGGEPTIYGVESFIAPRERMLTDGTLTDSASGPRTATPTSTATSPTTSAPTARPVAGA
ncbi:hypothetical protein [Actinoplanes sp. NPDC089786]|uniref:hypothetical protein n=1 Tax=Actinoplanes sp. NPDC089786 TaxID=3155185 RepID=UPI0034154649